MTVIDKQVRETPAWREVRSAIDKRVDRLRTKLETCSPDKLSDYQARISEYRKLISAVEEGEILE